MGKGEADSRADPTQLDRAKALLASSEVRPAIAVLQGVLQQERGHPEARKLLGICAYLEGDLHAARLNLQFARERIRGDAELERFISLVRSAEADRASAVGTDSPAAHRRLAARHPRSFAGRVLGFFGALASYLIALCIGFFGTGFAVNYVYGGDKEAFVAGIGGGLLALVANALLRRRRRPAPVAHAATGPLTPEEAIHPRRQRPRMSATQFVASGVRWLLAMVLGTLLGIAIGGVVAQEVGMIAGGLIGLIIAQAICASRTRRQI